MRVCVCVRAYVCCACAPANPRHLFLSPLHPRRATETAAAVRELNAAVVRALSEADADGGAGGVQVCVCVCVCVHARARVCVCVCMCMCV